MSAIRPLAQDEGNAKPMTVDIQDEAPAQARIVEPNAAVAESIGALRTRIFAQHVRQGRRALALCTPMAGSGCTFVTGHLAAALAQIGINVVLVDTDLRTPGIAGMFGIRSAPGLADYLTDPALSVETIMVEEVIPGLTVIPAGEPPSNPQELLSGTRFRTLVEGLLREFDLAIFDTTPANGCADAQRVATVANYAAIVGRKHETFVSDVRTLSGLLRADGATVIGTILNDY